MLDMFFFHFTFGHRGRLCKIHRIIFTIILRVYAVVRLGAWSCEFCRRTALCPIVCDKQGLAFRDIRVPAYLPVRAPAEFQRLSNLKLYAACAAFGLSGVLPAGGDGAISQNLNLYHIICYLAPSSGRLAFRCKKIAQKNEHY